MGTKYTWHSSKQKGVRYRIHPTRKVQIGAVKAHDKYFSIRYQKDGQRIEEGLGWSSEGWTEDAAFNKLTELRSAANKKDDAPTRLSEERERKAEAKRQREEAKRQAEEEKKRRELENVTVEKYFTDTYLPTIKTHRKNLKDLHDESHFRLWLAPVVGSKPIKDVAAFDLERIKANMQKAKKSPRTIQYVFATFRQIWNMARRDKVVSDDSPTKEVKLAKVANERDRYLTREEADALLKELERLDLTTYRFAVVSLYTGLRFEEIARLTRRCVDTAGERIRVSDPKNSETRYAYITPPVKAILDSLPEGKPDDVLFPQKNGLPHTECPRSFHRALDTLRFNKGITDKRLRVCFHTLRHTYASWLVMNGVDLFTVARLMGHKTISMTARYAHLSPEHKMSASRIIAEISAPVAEGDTEVKAA